MNHEPMTYILRYNLRPEAGAQFTRWLEDQAGNGSEHAGWRYVGTFFDVMGCDRYDYETRWELNGNGSVCRRPLDSETEQRIGERLPFMAEGQVSMMKALRGIG